MQGWSRYPAQEVRPMKKFLQSPRGLVLSITALILLIKRLMVRKPPSRPYRHQKDEWSKIRAYRRPN